MKSTEMPPRERDAWLAELRARFTDVARRRVPSEAVEDLVQEALAVVFEKGGEGSREHPSLPWCFQVLRNVVGNYYQRRRTRDVAHVPGSSSHARIQEVTAGATGPTPLEALERAEVAVMVRSAIDALAARDEMCGELLRAMLEDAPAARGRSVSTGSSTSHVRAFRCRQKLKRILLERGILA